MFNSEKERNLTRMAEFRDSLLENPQLTYLFFELTDACNMACMHCGSHASPENNRYLAYEDINKVMEATARAYNPEDITVCLTGGEPLMHKDFFKIAERARELGFRCGITTNGTLIDDATAKKIRECGITAISVSLDGLKENHDRFRCKPGAYDKALWGVRNLLKASEGYITVQVTTVLHKKNIGDLDAMYEIFCKEKLHSWRIIEMEPIGRALEQDGLMLDADEIRYMLDYIKNKRFSEDTPMQVTYGCSHYLGLEYEHTVRPHYFMCLSGIAVASVLCNGDIYSCLDIERRPELVQGNIHKDDFVDVWENRFQAFRRDRTTDCKECTECTHRRFCNGDSAHTWDYTNNRPLVCVNRLYK